MINSFGSWIEWKAFTVTTNRACGYRNKHKKNAKTNTTNREESTEKHRILFVITVAFLTLKKFKAIKLTHILFLQKICRNLLKQILHPIKQNIMATVNQLLLLTNY